MAGDLAGEDVLQHGGNGDHVVGWSCDCTVHISTFEVLLRVVFHGL